MSFGDKAFNLLLQNYALNQKTYFTKVAQFKRIYTIKCNVGQISGYQGVTSCQSKLNVS